MLKIKIIKNKKLKFTKLLTIDENIVVSYIRYFSLQGHIAQYFF